MKQKLLIYGTGLVAEVAAFYFQQDSDYELIGFANASEFISAQTFCGLPVFSFDSIESSFSPAEFTMFIALGYSKTNQIRQARFHQAKTKGYKCATYISSRAVFHGTEIGENCMVFEHNVVQPFVTIGDNCFLWSGNHIGHHSTIQDNCFISSHVVISGACKIGNNCFIGVNATLRDNITLGRYVVIGAGAVVMTDCEDRAVVRAPRSEYLKIPHDVI